LPLDAFDYDIFRTGVWSIYNTLATNVDSPSRVPQGFYFPRFRCSELAVSGCIYVSYVFLPTSYMHAACRRWCGAVVARWPATSRSRSTNSALLIRSNPQNNNKKKEKNRQDLHLIFEDRLPNPVKGRRALSHDPSIFLSIPQSPFSTCTAPSLSLKLKSLKS
jgi:hypothetical protein